MTETLEVTTESNQQYKFYPVASGSIRFEVKTWKDAHLVLTSGPKETDPRYEIIIGGWENTKSVIRKKGKNPDQKEIQTPGILTDKEFRRFSIRWDGNTVQVHQYTEGQSQPRKLMEFKDPDRFPITFVGVGTGWGASGTWKFEDGTEVFTPDSKDKLQYKYAPVSTGYLHFVYRGPHNAHVCLTSGPRETDPMYEINFGGDDNMKSAIRYRRNASDKVNLETFFFYPQRGSSWPVSHLMVSDDQAEGGSELHLESSTTEELAILPLTAGTEMATDLGKIVVASQADLEQALPPTKPNRKICPHWESNPGPLRLKQVVLPLDHIGGF